MATCFHPAGLFFFYSTWALVAHAVFFLGLFFGLVSASALLPSTFLLAWVVFVGGMLGNVLYIPMYNWRGNLLRVPYELVMHVLPLVLYYFTAAGRKNQVQWDSPMGWLVPATIAIFYSAYYGLGTIGKFYEDPIHYVFGPCS
jgi:hypothetical protein